MIISTFLNNNNNILIIIYYINKPEEAVGVSQSACLCTILCHFSVQIVWLMFSHWKFHQYEVHLKYPDDALNYLTVVCKHVDTTEPTKCHSLDSMVHGAYSQRFRFTKTVHSYCYMWEKLQRAIWRNKPRLRNKRANRWLVKSSHHCNWH